MAEQEKKACKNLFEEIERWDVDVKQLIEEGMDVNERDEKGRTPLFYSARNVDDDYYETTKLLIESGAELEVRDKDGMTPLLFISNGIDELTTRTLIEAGANIEARDNKGATGLIRVFRDHGYEDSIDYGVFDILLEYGANPNIQDRQGRTPLMYVGMEFGDEYAADKLIKHGADVNLRDAKGWTALHYAAENYGGFDEDNRLLRLLVEAGAEVNARNNDGATALHYVAENFGDFDGEYNFLKLLVEAGTEVNARNKKGETALILAAKQVKWATEERTDVAVKTLMAYGADSKIRDNSGRSAADYIRKNLGEDDECRELLLKRLKSGKNQESIFAYYEIDNVVQKLKWIIVNTPGLKQKELFQRFNEDRVYKLEEKVLRKALGLVYPHVDNDKRYFGSYRKRREYFRQQRASLEVVDSVEFTANSSGVSHVGKHVKGKLEAISQKEAKIRTGDEVVTVKFDWGWIERGREEQEPITKGQESLEGQKQDVQEYERKEREV